MPIPIISQLRAYLAEKLDIHATNNSQSRKQIIKPVNSGSGDQKVLVLNVARLGKEELAEAQKVFKEEFDKSDVLLVNDETKRLANGIDVSESTTKNGEIVEYFGDKLKPTDWQIFRTGLYINYLIEAGMPTTEIRRGVLATYGIRGRNILNLASAGHFESHIKPLYQEMSKAENFTSEIFYGEFERILHEMPFAIFVNHSTDMKTLCRMIDEKIEQGKKNMIKERRLYIHGWGSNVRTIERAVETLDSGSLKIEISKRKEVTEIIDVTIEF
jgi:hypothetical protein